MNVHLVPYREEHVDQVHAWENHPDIIRNLLHFGIPREQVARRVHAPEDGPVLHLAIETDDDTLVGSLTLGHEPPPPMARGSFELIIGPEFQRRGFGRQALQLMPDRLKAWRNLDVIEFYVFSDNTAAVALYEELGYEEQTQMWFWKGNMRRHTLVMTNNPDAYAPRRTIGFRGR